MKAQLRLVLYSVLITHNVLNFSIAAYKYLITNPPISVKTCIHHKKPSEVNHTVPSTLYSMLSFNTVMAVCLFIDIV